MSLRGAGDETKEIISPPGPVEGMMTRQEYDEFYNKGDCPPPSSSAPRKWQYLPMTRTSWIHGWILRLLWLPLGVFLFVVVLFLNLFYFVWTVTVLGGIRQNALRTTQPRSSLLLRGFILNLIDVFNVTEIHKPWDAAKATKAFQQFRTRNNFSTQQVHFEVHEIPDTVGKREVVHKYHKAEAYPATLHRVWVLCAPSKTYICSATNFAEFDGTSAFNLVKAFVDTYYDGTSPLVRPRPNDPELDLKLMDDPEFLNKLNWGRALMVCFVEAYKFAVCYGRYLLSREVFDMLACAPPEVCTAIEWIDCEMNDKMTKQIQQRSQKMFPLLMSTSARALNQCSPKVTNPILLTQVSCQSRYYKPAIAERNLCGNWLVGLGAKPTLGELQDPRWCNQYYKKIRNDIESFSGDAAYSFIAQTMLGFNSTAHFANPRHVYWFNNYGRRSMHKDAGGVTYHWGPNYGVAVYCLVNVLTVDGRTCITLLSSVIPQGELQRAASLMKQYMIEEADGCTTSNTSSDADCTASATKKNNLNNNY